ncbi:DoxX family membrane protein [bacterium]|nr:DoxX family membrane protein [bacterium]
MPMIARILFGLIFFVFGLNGFLQFMPTPPPPEAAASFFGAMMQTGYFFPLLKATEIICGILLLSGSFVPLALVVLAPIILQIFFFHLFLAPSGLAMAVILGAIEIYLAFFSPYAAKLKPLFKK